ncbi:MAG: hypothetical protein ABJ218_08005 [Winogradskyella arenosi]
MKQKYKKLAILGIVLLCLVGGLTYAANYVVSQKLEAALADLSPTVKVTYKDLHVALWGGDVWLSKPKVVLSGKTTGKTLLDAQLQTIELNDLSYWDYIVHNEITAKNLNVVKLIATYNHNPVVTRSSYEQSFLEGLTQNITIESLALKQADILIKNAVNDSVILSASDLNFKISELKIKGEAQNKDEKLEYKSYHLQTKALNFAANPYEDLAIDSVDITNHTARLSGFQFRTKYSKPEYDAVLKKERDHFKVLIKDIKLQDLDFGFNQEERFYFTSKSVLLNTPKAEIYRNKLLPDDTSTKLLYSRMLRDLDFQLGLETLKIKNGTLSYLEKVKVDEPAGRLDFTEMNARIWHLGNTFLDEDTVISINTQFMDSATLNVDWNFKVPDSTDQFIFKADLQNFKASELAQFTKPNLNVDLQGELQQTYFTIGGDSRLGQIDLKVNYDDFKVAILRKDGKEKNKLLSTLVNLFVSKDSDDEKNNYRFGHSESVERDTTKSVFNFVWLNIKAALLSAMAGDGEKES